MAESVAGVRCVRAALLLLCTLSPAITGWTQAPAPPAAPLQLQDTGLYADFPARSVDPAHLAFVPQYPLWTDGAAKRRWLSLPPGSAIDGSDPDNWDFPVGTRFWKEFSFDGRPVETRYIERLADGSWLYAAYAWNEDGTAAELVPERGRRNVYPLTETRAHDIPSVSDCRVCHAAGQVAVLGFSAIQLSPDLDPGGLHRDLADENAVDLDTLIERGLLVGYPRAEHPPRIAAATPTERAALGYLHGNCGHCHNTGAKLKKLGLFLRHVSEAPVAPGVTTTIGLPIRKRAPGQSPESLLRIEPGHPERSGLAERTASRSAALQMPPLGTEIVDEQAVALIRRWITELEPVQNQQQQGQGD